MGKPPRGILPRVYKRGLMRHAVFWCIWAVVGAILGCLPPQEQAKPATTGRSVVARSSNQPEGARRKVVSVRIGLIDLPAGAASDSEDIWAGLAEAPVEAADLDRLRENGLRVGVARPADREHLTDTLRALTGREVRYVAIAALGDAPGSVTLKEGQPDRTIFTVGREGAVRGADYPPGDYAIGVGCRINENDPSRILMAVVPQVRTGAPEPPGMRVVGPPAARTHKEVLGLEAGTVTVTLSAGDILVIGPSGRSARASSIGHCFLTGSREGLPYETVVLLTPEVIAFSLP